MTDSTILPVYTPRPSKLGPALVIVATLLTVLSPIVQNFERRPTDNFPLSHYPMFSAKRSAHFSGQTLVGIDAEGNRHRIRHTFAGTGGFNQVRRQISAAVKEDRALETCNAVAKRLSRSKRYTGPRLTSVQVITATHHIDSFFAGDQTPVAEKLHAACPVPEPKKSKREVK
jgi:hypothetical protein